MSIGKILICDDDRNICELLRLYLEKVYSKTTGFGEYSLNESCPSCEFWRQALILRFSMGFP